MSDFGNPAPGRLAGLALQLSRDKADALLLLVAAVLVLAPHAAHLPFWISALCAATLLWRGVITFRGKRMPHLLVLLPISIGAMAGVYASFDTLLGRDAGVAMLVLLVAFKTLEMHARRDLFVVIYLCLFLVLTNFFYSQSIGTALLMMLSIVVLLTAQLSFQFTGTVPPLKQRLLIGAKIFGLAAPLALVLFFVFPRIQGPLWGLPGDANSGRNGLSNSMAPGNLSSLALSDEPAFQVKFLDPPPPQKALYWRGIVLSQFDGRTWTQASRGPRRGTEIVNPTVSGPPLRHQVTLEPHFKRWLFALDIPSRLPLIPGNEANISAELEMLATNTIDQRVRYDVTSHIEYSLQASETLPERERWLALPRGYNPESLAMARYLQRRHEDPVERIRAVLQLFSKNYTYSLEPPRLGQHSVDDFLFNTRTGFCEHFASSFVVLMRGADIPARVVTGYQGGETNPVDGFLSVRQSDAHAWAEVWLAGRGWLRVDPTASVAPERVERPTKPPPRTPPFGIESLGALMNFELDRDSWLARLRYQISAMNNGWNQWVLNYSPERQRGFMHTLEEVLMRWQSAAALLAIFVIIYAMRRFAQRRRMDPVDALYWHLCQRMGQLGMARAPDEGPSAYAQRLSAQNLQPGTISALTRFLQLYSAHKYGPPAPDSALAATLKSLLNEIR